ncbi:hypothetical protein LZ32DRAFT_608472 [Colletotrichum eremochloae]|nr:hypothetical protein LZ32DRAFT_608472 [Colletotrichum eremochloae]
MTLAAPATNLDNPSLHLRETGTKTIADTIIMRATAPRLGARILRPVQIPPRPLPAPRPPASKQATKSAASLLSHCGISFGTTRTKRSFAISIGRCASTTSAACRREGNDVQHKHSTNSIITQPGRGLVDFKWPAVLPFPNSIQKSPSSHRLST